MRASGEAAAAAAEAQATTPAYAAAAHQGIRAARVAGTGACNRACSQLAPAVRVRELGDGANRLLGLAGHSQGVDVIVVHGADTCAHGEGSRVTARACLPACLRACPGALLGLWQASSLPPQLTHAPTHRVASHTPTPAQQRPAPRTERGGQPPEHQAIGVLEEADPLEALRQPGLAQPRRVQQHVHVAVPVRLGLNSKGILWVEC